jgi:hypothetical protein
MKIRIKDNSIRMRLTRPEVQRFGKEKYVEGRTEFGNVIFIYAMRCDSAVEEISAYLFGNKITMHIPGAIAEAFVNTDAVGFQHEQVFDNGKKLSLLFEKDFKCIDGEVLEDQSDNYDNPSAICKQ